MLVVFGWVILCACWAVSSWSMVCMICSRAAQTSSVVIHWQSFGSTTPKNCSKAAAVALLDARQRRCPCRRGLGFERWSLPLLRRRWRGPCLARCLGVHGIPRCRADDELRDAVRQSKQLLHGRACLAACALRQWWQTDTDPNANAYADRHRWADAYVVIADHGSTCPGVVAAMTASA